MVPGKRILKIFVWEHRMCDDVTVIVIDVKDDDKQSVN